MSETTAPAEHGRQQDDVTWRPMRPEDAAAIAELHGERHPEVPADVMIKVLDHNAAARALAEQFDLQPIRDWFEMSRPLDAVIPDVASPARPLTRLRSCMPRRQRGHDVLAKTPSSCWRSSAP